MPERVPPFAPGSRARRAPSCLSRTPISNTDPAEYGKLLAPILEDRADVVYGSRYAGALPHRVPHFAHRLANAFLTLLSNVCTGLHLTDMEVGYKVFRRSILEQITLRSNRFEIEPELTQKIARLRPRVRFYEVGICYHGRTYDEGKKITWRDGFAAIWAILRYRFLG